MICYGTGEIQEPRIIFHPYFLKYMILKRMKNLYNRKTILSEFLFLLMIDIRLKLSKSRRILIQYDLPLYLLFVVGTILITKIFVIKIVYELGFNILRKIN